MSDPIKTTAGLKPGDVCTVAVKITPRDGSDPYWWTSFRVIVRVHGPRSADMLVLKMRPDMDKDMRMVDFSSSDTVVCFLPPERWPQGVVASRMALILKKIITIEE